MKAKSTMSDPDDPEAAAVPEAAPADSFDRLFMAEYGKVVAVANRVLADRAEAEDVAQEVFLDYHRRHRADAGYAAAWLRRAAVHTALNRIRGRKRRERREVKDHVSTPPSQPDPGEMVIAMEEKEQVREALGRLPRKAASVLALRYSGLSYIEVGEALGVGAGQIGTLLRRAEHALRKEMTHGTPV
ncbi:MAG: sigma-70 family RNA polymerase sigma factor [Candidatus Dormibacteraeota bacterium]|nr:sigma-70 family RNA polymerase sigma factor [Candidatus Dormibacteraeota bacterium]